jgi:asparagine synthase (glutamine-hydrolysing)
MCGVATILLPPGRIGDPRASEQIGAMIAALRHRGPDANGVSISGPCVLGHTRLKVIDFEGGTQPMSSEDGRYLLCFNGEIFNFRELRQNLEKLGVSHATQSDTEVLLNHLIQFGKNGLSQLNGQFAFVFWDAERRVLLAARDQAGQKPLFWTRTKTGELMFASEIKALLTTPTVSRVVNRDAIGAYFRLNYVPPHQSIYADIHPVRPGAFVECVWREEQWRVEENRFWKPQMSTSDVHDLDEFELGERIQSSFRAAVERSVVADAPLGAFLSGGLDSSTIVATMARFTDRPVKTFSVGFGDEIDELPYARAVADRYGTDHHEIQMDLQVAEILGKLSEVYDEPFADSSNVPTYAISQAARTEVTVALSGDGGDELFGGYRWYVPLMLGEKLSNSALSKFGWNMASLMMRLLCRVAGRYIPKDRRMAIPISQELNLKETQPDLWRRHVSRTAGFDRIIGGFDDQQLLERFRENMTSEFWPREEVSSMDRATWFDYTCYLPGDILKKVDMASMAVSLETRAPFLDQEFVDLMLAIPSNRRFQDAALKPLMKQAFRSDWPESVGRRSKQGFGAPVQTWLRRPDVAALVGKVSAPNSILSEALPDCSKRLKQARGQEAWQLLCLGLWMEKYQPEAIE